VKIPAGFTLYSLDRAVGKLPVRVSVQSHPNGEAAVLFTPNDPNASDGCGH
jgi:hypothetical protein